MSLLVGYYSKYPIYLSDKPDKKYYALVKDRKVYFGQQGYEHYYDKFGYYSNLDHNDNERRKNFKLRFNRYRKKRGSAAFFSDKILW